MHGFSSGCTFLVNAEVDSMGGVVDGGVGIGTKPSPRRAAIEKAQAELRLEYDVREERRRELEFLEKGGNPLDFKFGHAASVSVQSTTQTNQHPDQLLNSEAKDSFALTASPHGDSVESSGRLGVTTACEPNSADNFDGENELLRNESKSKNPGRGSITPSEHSSQLDGSQNVKDSEDSPIFHPKKGQAYRRRNRSRPNRDGPRSSSADAGSRGGHGPTLPNRQGMPSKPVASENQFEMESDGTNAPRLSTTLKAREFPEGLLDVSTSKDKQEELLNQSVKPDETPVATSRAEPDSVVDGKENVVPVDADCPPCSAADETEDKGIAAQLNESGMLNGDGKLTQTEVPISSATQTTKALDSESSCTPTRLSVDVNGNIDSQLHANLKNVDSNGSSKGPELSIVEESLGKDEQMLNEQRAANVVETSSCIKEDTNSPSHHGNGFADKDLEETGRERSFPRDDADGPSNVQEQEADNRAETNAERQAGLLGDSIPKLESSRTVSPSSVNPICQEPNHTDLSSPPLVSQPQSCVEDQPKLVDKAHEDRILEEARIIEAKRKRIAELSVGLLPRECRRKSHWDFVLEEMAWLANDFAQERLWKMTAAAQICHRVASASRLRSKEQNKCWKQRNIAHTVAKAVMEFWHSAESCSGHVECLQSQNFNDSRDDESKVEECRAGSPEKDGQSRWHKRHLALQRYAVRFLQFNCSSTPVVKVEVSGSPDGTSGSDLPRVPWQEELTEENLFYVVPSGAMETYRKSIEQCLSSEKTGKDLQEEVDTSMYDAASEFGYQENDYEEDEGENVFYLPGAFDSGKPSKKKRKNIKRSYEIRGDAGYGHCVENRNGTPQFTLMGKRSSNSLHVGPIPTKRMRTASRQRVIGPFNSTPAGVAPVSRTDASSGDTNSFQDDQSILHGGSVVPRGLEVDSAMDFEKQSTFDSTEISAKPKKKKKIKHQGAAYDQRWQLESAMQNEQKDLARKRMDNYELESNGNNGLFGQHAKKPKMMKQSLDNSFDNSMPMSGSVASPVASQMSNMSNQSRIIKLIGGRDRGRKAKALKVHAGQPGSGSPWSLFEDQALVVLVHDMGPNWELVSDAMNSTLQFKCIYRKPQECKERHKTLMGRTAGDGADSAEDSGSSQPYPSTLTGIPQGSARQLFQRLQGPMEEDTIKSHFEKIIHIGQLVHYRKKQNDNQDMKQIAPVHGSHMVALSQVIPNNVNGGILTPLDLCDAAASSQDLLPLYQGAHAGGLGLPHQGTIPPNGLNSPLQGVQGSPGMGIGNNLASQSAQFSNSRYSVPRPGSLPVEEQQRQYNHMLSGRNMQPSNVPSTGGPSGNDRSVRMVPGGNGVGMMTGMNRGMPMPRPGLQGITSSSMLNSGSMLPNNMNMHSAAGPGQGNSMFRPRDALHAVRPGQSSEHSRQMMMPDVQMQGTQSNSPGVPSFGGLNSGFSSQAPSPPVQTYPGHHQHHPHVIGSHHPHVPGSNHAATPEQQQALMRLAREREIRQRLLQRQQQQQHQHQQQLPSSNPMMTHVQTSGQLPLSSPLQSSSQLQSQASSQPSSLPPMTPSSPMTHPKQQVVPPQAVGRSGQSAAGGMMNQAGKQRQRPLQQQYQQAGRQHPQQRQQQSHAQQQAKILKGMGGRGNMLIHQNHPMDPSQLNGISANPGAQVSEKAEQSMHLMQGQGLYSGSGLNTTQQSKSLASSQTSSHSQTQKPYANSVQPTSKQVQPVSSHVDGGSQSQIPTVASSPASAASSNQGSSSSVMPSLSHQQLHSQSKPSVKVVNKSQPALQRLIPVSRQVNSDPLAKSQANHTPQEQQFTNNSSKVEASVVPTGCVDSTTPIPLSSSERKAQEPLSGSSMPSSSTSSIPIDSPALSNSSGNEQLPSVSQGLGKRQLSGNLVSHGLSVGSQWQQQQSQLQQPPPVQLPILPQKQPQRQLVQPPEGDPQPQPQPQCQSGQGGVFTRATNSRLE